MVDRSVSKNTRSPTFWRKSATDPGVTVVVAGAAACWSLLQAAMKIIAAMAAKALIMRISSYPFARVRTSQQSVPGTSTRAQYARVDKINHIVRYCGIKGDQAGSDASVGVGIWRSKRPVMSI